MAKRSPIIVTERCSKGYLLRLTRRPDDRPLSHHARCSCGCGNCRDWRFDMIEQLGRFKHHPDLSTDFCCELESLEGYVEDIRAGGRSQWPFWARLSWLLKF